MDFCAYLGKIVKIDISSGYYFYGKIISVDDNFLEMIDKNQKHVTISIKDILNIREISS